MKSKFWKTKLHKTLSSGGAAETFYEICIWDLMLPTLNLNLIKFLVFFGVEIVFFSWFIHFKLKIDFYSAFDVLQTLIDIKLPWFFV